jgi:nitrate/nitrite transporter NarK
MCLAIPGPFAGLAPFFAIPTETMPRNVMGPVIGLVNAFGSGVGGFFGPLITGWLKQKYNGITVPFVALGIGMLVGASLCVFLPKSPVRSAALAPAPAGGSAA